ncbi:replicative DNA helicase [Thermosporothrix hazakensis]|jgi:replicative DNA helicase|uniref:Replicative DNA helicase n=1 Tax=Thermosporothrix hazakensis TaxID=644383 RepID=A0A326TWY4_THEHA|nr:replicative DNA helicase [Thermosporothrix hazakensis]PZW20994.1 replicative DNA helicase [Thermosporothrix hazakensis]GCE49277.1 replicative DNA helicase [Thermosporothrix hazakensis]
MPKERLLPFNLDAERGVLGSILIDPDVLPEVVTLLKPDDFYRDAHRLIYAAILRLNAQHIQADYLTVSHELSRMQQLDAAEGQSYLVSLVNEVPTSGNVRYYAQIVASTAVQRRLIHAAADIAALAYSDLDAQKALEQAEERLFQIRSASASRSNGFIDLPDVMTDYMTRLHELAERRGQTPLTGIPSGLRDLDFLLGGFQRADLIIVGGRPSMGKTAFALTCAYRAALCNYRVAMFSLEMPRTQLAQRWMAMTAKVDMARLRSGWIEDEEWDRIYAAGVQLSRMPISINDTAAQPLVSMRADLRRLVQTHGGVDLVVVDYVGLIDPDTETAQDNEVRQLTAISRGLKHLAREFDVPVLALAQLNRQVETRQNKRPQLSDLRGSGSLEQDADVVLFLYRDAYYREREEREQQQADPESSTGTDDIAEVICAKQRNGPTGEIALCFQKTQGVFYDLDHAISGTHGSER